MVTTLGSWGMILWETDCPRMCLRIAQWWDRVREGNSFSSLAPVPPGQTLPMGCEAHHRTVLVSECSADSYRWDEGNVTALSPGPHGRSSLSPHWMHGFIIHLPVYFFPCRVAHLAQRRHLLDADLLRLWELTGAQDAVPAFMSHSLLRSLQVLFIPCMRWSPTWILFKQKNHLIMVFALEVDRGVDWQYSGYLMVSGKPPQNLMI